MELYDLIVLGGGPAGYLAGERAGQAGLKTLVVEKRALGGVCLNEGCIPSKAFLHSAKVYDYVTHGEKYGVTTSGAKLDHAMVVQRKNRVVKTLVSGVEMQLKRNHVTVESACGEILGRAAEGFEIKVGDKTFMAKRLLIATGSAPIGPPIPGVKEGIERGFVLTNRELLDLTEIPKSFVVIGGGVIGLEMASYFNSAGSSVTVIEMLDKIAGNTDSEISDILRKNYEKKGVTFKLSCKVTGVDGNEVSFEEKGMTKTIGADKVLLSIGRRAVTQGFGLEKIGVLVERGAIRTDECMRTNIPGVYAAGDVNGMSMLAHTAYREAEVAVNHMTGKKDRMRYQAVPSVIYTNPEVACVGETLESANQKGLDAEAVTLTMKYSGRYVAENEDGDGIAKIIIDKKYRRILGAHLIGSYVSEMIFGLAMMVETEMLVDDIKEIVFPHPTVSEIIREAVFEYKD
jgi:dihydrolipoamide dehydrogenase